MSLAVRHAAADGAEAAAGDAVAPESTVISHAVNDGYKHEDVRTSWAEQRAAHVCQACHRRGHMEGEAECPFAKEAPTNTNISHAVDDGYEHTDVRTSWAEQRAAHVCQACHQTGHMEGEAACPFAAKKADVAVVAQPKIKPGVLYLCIEECQGLKGGGFLDRTPDAYAIIEFVQTGKDGKETVLCKCETHHVPDDHHPVWGDEFETPAELGLSSYRMLRMGGVVLRITVWDYNIGLDCVLGRPVMVLVLE